MAIPSSARGAKGSPPPAGAASAPAGTPGMLRCAVCGTESRQPRTRHQPPEQAPDLDLRPGEPLRSTMASWLQQCPHCGYAAPDITRAHPAAAQAVAAAPFRALVNDATHPALARRFLGWAHVLEESGALHAAAEATLQAAWVADDERQPELSRAWRLDAVAMWRAGPPLDHEQTVRVVDALRRAGQWDDAETSARTALGDNPPEAAAQVLALEARLIAGQDDGRHTVASALPPPSRRPHVSHHRPGATGEGLWRRLRRWLGRG